MTLQVQPKIKSGGPALPPPLKLRYDMIPQTDEVRRLPQHTSNVSADSVVGGAGTWNIAHDGSGCLLVMAAPTWAVSLVV